MFAGTSATFKNSDVSCALTPTNTGTGLIFAVTSTDGATKYKTGYTVSCAAAAHAWILHCSYCVADQPCAMQITDGAVLGSSVKGFTGTPIAVPAAAPNSGLLLLNSTSSQGCEDNVFVPPCMNPLAFTLNSTTLMIRPTDTDFCPIDDGDASTPLKISGQRLCEA